MDRIAFVQRYVCASYVVEEQKVAVRHSVEDRVDAVAVVVVVSDSYRTLNAGYCCYAWAAHRESREAAVVHVVHSAAYYNREKREREREREKKKACCKTSDRERRQKGEGR